MSQGDLRSHRLGLQTYRAATSRSLSPRSRSKVLLSREVAPLCRTCQGLCPGSHALLADRSPPLSTALRPPDPLDSLLCLGVLSAQHAHTHSLTYTHSHTRILSHIHTHAHTAHSHTSTHTPTYMHTYFLTYIHSHTHAHTCIHTCIQTHMHTHTQRFITRN